MRRLLTMMLLAGLAACNSTTGAPLGDDAAFVPGIDGAPRPQRPDAGSESGKPQTPPTPCIEGDARVVDPATGHCYVVLQEPQPWKAASNACNDLPGMHMAVISDAAEVALIATLFEGSAWLGASDQAVEGTWRWTSDEPLTFSSWALDEPNNNGNQDCLVMSSARGDRWDDLQCGVPMPVVCERD